jgi:hypothetical protein
MTVSMLVWMHTWPVLSAPDPVAARIHPALRVGNHASADQYECSKPLTQLEYDQ